MTRGKKHTRQELLNAARKAWDKDLNADFRTSSMQRGRYRWIYRSHHYYWDNWRIFLAEIGLTYGMVKARAKEIKKRAYLKELREAYGAGIDLNSSAIQTKGNPNRGYYDRGHYFYSGRSFWEQALTEAGLPVEEIVKQRAWDKELIKACLLARKEEKKSLKIKAIEEDDYLLYRAIFRHFDNSYEASLNYAGINPEGIIVDDDERRQRTLSEVIEKIIGLHFNYQSLRRSHILATDDKDLHRYVYAADRLLRDKGKWEGAVVLAGLSYGPYRTRKAKGFWNEAVVFEEGLRIIESGVPWNSTYLNAHYSGWMHATHRYSGGWRGVLKLLSVPPMNFSRINLFYLKVAWAVLFHPGGLSLDRKVIKARVEEIKILSGVSALVNVSLQNVQQAIDDIFSGRDRLHSCEEISFCRSIKEKWPGKSLQEIVNSIPDADFKVSVDRKSRSCLS